LVEKKNDIALKIDTALQNIGKNNKALKGALLDTINDIDTRKDKAHDIVGLVEVFNLSMLNSLKPKLLQKIFVESIYGIGS